MTAQQVTVYIGIGSNISPKKNIEKALVLLQEAVVINIISTHYRTPPLFSSDKRYFINGVWEITTGHSPHTLKFSILRNIEKELNRVRINDKNAPRTIDLDLLLYGDLVIEYNGLTVPDRDIYTRPFIHYPLFELNPRLVLPDSGAHISDLCKQEHNMIPDIRFTSKLKALINDKN